MTDSHTATTPHRGHASIGTAIGPETDPRLLRVHAEGALARARTGPLGQVSDQIPRLSRVSPDSLAIAVGTVTGEVVTAGDADTAFSLQSITKLFALCALLRYDAAAWTHVGWGPTAAGYASVAELELHKGQPRNPFVNSGALVVTDSLHVHSGDASGTTRELIATQAGSDSVRIDHEMARSEAAADHRNAAIAHVLAAHQRLANPVAVVLDQYFTQCAIEATTRELARAGLFLARRGGSQALDGVASRRVNAVLLTSGMYGAAGDIAHRIGLPAKSGIGGGVLAVLPGVGTVAVWSPGLDEHGSSSRGVAALEAFSHLAGWSIF